jgi:hypothetical protein
VKRLLPQACWKMIQALILLMVLIVVFGIDKYTNFMITDKSIRQEIIEILLKNKAEINAKNKAGETPLHIG